MVEDSDDSLGAASDPIEGWIEACLARPEAEWDEALRALLRDRPEQAAEIRRRVAYLAEFGIRVPGVDRGPPDRLGDFHLIRRLGVGGMGVVHLARQESLDRTVALKLIRPDHLFFPAARERFRREVEAIGRLQHPGIVPVHVVGEEQGTPYFAMEWVIGCSLADVLGELEAERPESVEGARFAEVVARGATRRAGEAVRTTAAPVFSGAWTRCCVRIARDLAEALQYAHERGVLHRDVKPSNVLVARDGRVLLLDFGVASTLGAERITRTGSQVGSLPYMSPEQIRGEELDARTDVYGIGVTLFELLALRLPFDGRGTEELRRQVIEGELPSLRALNREVDAELETVCLKALDRDPERRYASARELARDLQNLLDRRPILARRPGLRLRAWRWGQRHPTSTVALLLGFLLLVVGPSTVAILLGRKQQDLRAAEQRAIEAREQAEREARTARRTAEFVVRVFQNADPAAAGDPDLTVREALDRELPGLLASLQDEPRVRGSLLRAVSEIYLSIGRGEDARRLGEEALRLACEYDGPDSSEALASRATLARIDVQLGEFQRALDRLEENERGLAAMQHELEAWERAQSERARVRADALLRIGEVEAGERAAREAIRRADASGRALEQVVARSILATHWLEEGRHHDAARMFEEIVQRAQEAELPRQVLRNLGRLALSQHRAGELERAADSYRRAFDFGHDSLPAELPEYEELLNNYATFRHQRGDLEGCAALLEQSLQRAGLRGVEATPTGVGLRINLALVLWDLGRPERTREHCEAVLALPRQPDGEYPMDAIALELLAQCERERGEAGAAAEAAQEAARRYSEVGASTGVARVSILQAELLADAGEVAAAATRARRALDVLAPVGDQEHQVARAWLLLAGAHLADEDFDEAEAALLRAHEAVRSGPRRSTARRVLQRLVAFYEDRDRLDAVDRFDQLLVELEKGGR